MSNPPVRRHVVLGLTSTAAFGAGLASAAPTDSAASLNFLVVGDWGRRGADHQRDVAMAMDRAAAELDSRFVLSVGDNFYPDGVVDASDSHWKQSYEDVYSGPHLQTPWYVALGNHDYHGEPQAQLDYARTSPRWRMPSRYYKVSGAALGLASVDLFCIDTTPMLAEFTERSVRHSGLPVDRQNTAEQLAWLDRALAASDARWKLVFGHHTLRSGGSAHGDTPEIVEKVLPILQRRGAAAYICGHDHDLQHIRRDGLDYILTGAGSQVRPVRPVEGTQFCTSISGFTAVRVGPESLSFEFRSHTGARLYGAALTRA